VPSGSAELIDDVGEPDRDRLALLDLRWRRTATSELISTVRPSLSKNRKP
jgi:hypothetical protein